MKRDSPPGWMEYTLRRFLTTRDGECISGDLLEEYRQEQLPRRGLWGADAWYLHQLISFVLIRIAGGLVMKGSLLAVCVFNVAAGTWLGVMEQVLRHSGFGGRSVIAACIVVQAVLTAAVVMWQRYSPMRYAVEIGAVPLIGLGIFALYGIMRAKHFEGFVLIIGAALIVQGLLTFLALLPRRFETA